MEVLSRETIRTSSLPETADSFLSACPVMRRSQTKPKEHHLRIFVRDNNVDQALRALKRKLQREGVFREMKRRRFYEKPSEVRVREKSEAIRRLRKLARKQAQREGLIADPRKKKAQATRTLGNRQRTEPRVPSTR